MWITAVIPSLLPFFILSSILEQTHVIDSICKKSKNFTLIFATIIGSICGYPSNARIIGQSNESNNTSAKIFALSALPGPVFMIGSVSTIFLGNPMYSFVILPSIYISGVFTYLFIKLFLKSKPSKITYPSIPKTTQPFGIILKTAIIDSFILQGVIGGIIILVAIISTLLDVYGVISLLTILISPILNFLNFPINFARPLIIGFIEMSSGCSSFSTANLPMYYKIIGCVFILAIGGTAILFQNLSLINNKIKATVMILIKLLHGVLSVIICQLLLSMFPGIEAVFLPISNSAINLFIPAIILSTTACLVFAIILFFMHKKLS